MSSAAVDVKACDQPRMREFITVRRILVKPQGRDRVVEKRRMKESDDAFDAKSAGTALVPYISATDPDLIRLIHVLQTDASHPVRQEIDERLLYMMKMNKRIAKKLADKLAAKQKQLAQQSESDSLKKQCDYLHRVQKSFALMAKKNLHDLQHGTDDREVYEKAARRYLTAVRSPQVARDDNNNDGNDDDDETDDEEDEKSKALNAEAEECRKQLKFNEHAGRHAARGAWMVYNKLIETAIEVCKLWGERIPFFVPPGDGVTRAEYKLYITSKKKWVALLQYPYIPHLARDESGEREFVPHDEIEKAPAFFWHVCRLLQIAQEDIEVARTKEPLDIHEPYTARRVTTVRLAVSEYLPGWSETNRVWLFDLVLDYSVRSTFDFDHTDHAAPPEEKQDWTVQFQRHLDEEKSDQKKYDRADRRGDINLNKAPTRDLERYVFHTLDAQLEELKGELQAEVAVHLPGQGITLAEIESASRCANAAKYQRTLNANRHKAQLAENELENESKRLTRHVSTHGFREPPAVAAAAAGESKDLAWLNGLRMPDSTALSLRPKFDKSEVKLLGTYIPENVLKILLPLADYRKVITPGYYATNLKLRLSYHTDDLVGEQKAAYEDQVSDAIDGAFADDLADEVDTKKKVRTKNWSDGHQDKVMANVIREQNLRRFGEVTTVVAAKKKKGGYSALQ